MHFNILLNQITNVYCMMQCTGTARLFWFSNRLAALRHTSKCNFPSHNTDYVHVNGHDRTITVILTKYCTKLPDDGSLVIRKCWNNFKYFIIILIVSTNHIFVHLLDNIFDICAFVG